MTTPIPITAYALCNALGMTAQEVQAALFADQSGLGPPPLPLPFSTCVGVLPGVLPPLPAEYRRFDSRVARIAAHLGGQMDEAIAGAKERWGADRVAVVLGSSTAGMEVTEMAFVHCAETGQLPASYSLSEQHAFGACAEYVRQAWGLAGPTWVISTACSSSSKVFASAQRLIAAGYADAAIVGGMDCLCQMTLCGFHSLGILSSDTCRPFGAGRQGINIGEGGGMCLLERESVPGCSAHALLAVGESSDAHHMSAPHPEGRGAAAAMRSALAAAALTPSDVDYINAHGTATPLNDSAEAEAVREVFGGEIPLSSTKGFTGHMLGAAGITEALFCLMALDNAMAPANLGGLPQDPEVRLNILHSPKALRLRVALSNSFAFGGSNVSVLLGGAHDFC